MKEGLFLWPNELLNRDHTHLMTCPTREYGIEIGVTCSRKRETQRGVIQLGICVLLENDGWSTSGSAHISNCAR
jgi:hypothetical protein